MVIDKETEILVSMFQKLVKEKFTGNIQINFRLGGISNINKLESFKIEDLTK
jgi:hypothetical protein